MRADYLEGEGLGLGLAGDSIGGLAAGAQAVVTIPTPMISSIQGSNLGISWHSFQQNRQPFLPYCIQLQEPISQLWEDCLDFLCKRRLMGVYTLKTNFKTH
jgi:hypothetical protein